MQMKQVPILLAKQMDALQWISEQTKNLQSQTLQAGQNLSVSRGDAKSFRENFSPRYRM